MLPLHRLTINSRSGGVDSNKNLVAFFVSSSSSVSGSLLVKTRETNIIQTAPKPLEDLRPNSRGWLGIWLRLSNKISWPSLSQLSNRLYWIWIRSVNGSLLVKMYRKSQWVCWLISSRFFQCASSTILNGCSCLSPTSGSWSQLLHRTSNGTKSISDERRFSSNATRCMAENQILSQWNSIRWKSCEGFNLSCRCLR